MALGYLVCPTIQIQDINGKPIVGAKIYVYDANTSELTNTYKDFEGHLNTNPVLTDDLGNCTIVAENTKVYNIVVNDNNDNLLFSKENLTVDSSVTFLSVDPGYGIQITQEGSNYVISVDTDLIATIEDLAAKQDKLYAGNNIEIDSQNQINVVDRRELQAKYPIRLDRSNNALKVYLDEDYAPDFGNIQAGSDIAITRTQREMYVGVDTNSTASGYYNFYAGNSNTVSGDNNAVFGYGNNIVGDYNAGFGQSNNINGGNNGVFGQQNELTRSYNNIVGGNRNKLILGTDYGTNYSIVGGADNILKDASYSVVAGMSNSATDSVNSLVIGDYLDINNSHDSIFGGNGNKVLADNRANALFIGGTSNTLSGQYISNSMVFGSNNNVSNTDYVNDKIIGDHNTVVGTDKYVFGNNNTLTGTDNMYVFGHATSGIEGGLVLGVEGHNNFEVRKNDDIYYRYNGSMTQLAPYVGGTGISINNNQISCSGDITPYTAGNGISVNNHVISIGSTVALKDNITTTKSRFSYSVDHTLTQTEINGKSFTVSFSPDDYWSFIQNAKLTSWPQLCLQIAPQAAAGGIGNYLHWTIYAVYNDNSSNYLAWNEGGALYMKDPIFRSTFYDSKPSNLNRIDVVVGWYDMTGADAFNVNGHVYVKMWIEAAKLVIS